MTEPSNGPEVGPTEQSNYPRDGFIIMQPAMHCKEVMAALTRSKISGSARLCYSLPRPQTNDSKLEQATELEGGHNPIR